MKFIKFDKLTVKNFLSVGEETVAVTFDTGINVITGINRDKDDRRNGVGKSTIADAIYFTIFGNTLREIKKENVANNASSGQTETCVELTVIDNQRETKYSITRLLNPSKCYIYKDGVDKTRDSIANTSKYISDIICSSPEVFQNCIIMTLNNTVPFMAQKKNDKRKFIEGILNLQVFGDMLQHAKSEYSDVAKQLEVECAKYETTSNQIESINRQKQQQEQTIRDQLGKLQSRKKQNISEIEQLRQRSSTTITESVSDYEQKIQNAQTNINLCNEKHTNLITKISSIKTKNEHINNTLSKITTGAQTCPACLRPLADHDVQMIEKEKKELYDQLESNNMLLREMKNKLKTVDEIRKNLQLSITDNEKKINKQKIEIKEKDNLLKRINQLEQLNTEIENDMKDVSTNRTSFDNMINEMTDKLQSVQTVIDQHKQEINKLDIVKFVVSEEGVRSYIVKKILQLLNGKLAYYLKKMDANCMCVFNEYFEEQIIDEKGKICSYHNFSGAERKNIDLACLFAFMDIRRLQGDVAFNFSVYDELLDSSLDERGIDLVLDILRERVEKYNECVMVISHRKESVKFATNEIIFLEKVNGITRRVAPDAGIDK